MLLRLGNELVRRTAKTSEAQVAGRILVFLSKVFPLGERSGLNLRGDFNIENITIIDREADDLKGESSPTIGYKQFWRLQYHMLHPQQLLSAPASEWSQFCQVTLLILMSILFSDCRCNPCPI